MYGLASTWFWLIVGIWTAIWVCRVLFRFASNRLGDWYWNNRVEVERRKQDALRSYVETGKKNATVLTIGRSAFKTVEKRRIAYLTEKEKQPEFRCFSSYCECPACGMSDVHWLGDGTRICKKCRHEWRQT